MRYINSVLSLDPKDVSAISVELKDAVHPSAMPKFQLVITLKSGTQIKPVCGESYTSVEAFHNQIMDFCFGGEKS